MSKHKVRNTGKKRHDKALKRKNKSQAVNHQNSNSLEVILKKAKYRAENNIGSGSELKRDDQQIKDAKKHLADIYNYFNYLVFVKELVKGKVLNGVGLTIDLVQKGKEIISLSKRLEIVPLLEEDDLYAVELFEIAAKIQEVAQSIVGEVEKTTPFQKTIHHVMLQLEDSLPPHEGDSPRGENEIIEEVIRIAGQNFYHTELKPKAA